MVFDPSLSNKQIVFVDSSKVTYGELQAIANADVGEIEPMPKHDCAACGEDLGLHWAVKDGKDCHFTCQPGEPKPTNQLEGKEIKLKNGSTIRVSENPDGKSGELQGAGWSVIEPEPEISREDYELLVAYMQRQHDRARAWGKILSSLTPKQPPARHPSEPFGWHGRTGV